MDDTGDRLNRLIGRHRIVISRSLLLEGSFLAFIHIKLDLRSVSHAIHCCIPRISLSSVVGRASFRSFLIRSETCWSIWGDIIVDNAFKSTDFLLMRHLEVTFFIRYLLLLYWLVRVFWHQIVSTRRHKPSTNFPVISKSHNLVIVVVFIPPWISSISSIFRRNSLAIVLVPLWISPTFSFIPRT